MFSVGGVIADSYEIGIFPLGSVEFTGSVDLVNQQVTPIDAVGQVEILDIIFDGLFPRQKQDAAGQVGQLNIIFSGAQPIAGIGVSVITEILDVNFDSLLLYGPKILHTKEVVIARRWILTVKGIDLLPDITIPMSSFNEYLNKDSVVRYTITIPDRETYEPELRARIDSKFYITSIEEYASGGLDTVNTREISVGSVKGSRGDRPYVTVVGESVYVETEPKKLKVIGINSYTIGADGKRTIAAENDKNFLSGDTAVLPDGAELSIGVITRLISTVAQNMQLIEQ